MITHNLEKNFKLTGLSINDRQDEFLQYCYAWCVENYGEEEQQIPTEDLFERMKKLRRDLKGPLREDADGPQWNARSFSEVLIKAEKAMFLNVGFRETTNCAKSRLGELRDRVDADHSDMPRAEKVEWHYNAMLKEDKEADAAEKQKTIKFPRLTEANRQTWAQDILACLADLFADPECEKLFQEAKPAVVTLKSVADIAKQQEGGAE